MIIYPALDLLKGSCVRLYQGDFAATTSYVESPITMLNSFANAGSSWAHIVDLDGAKAGRIMQWDLIAQLAAESTLALEVGGGIRCTADLERLFALGVKRAVVGSVGVSQPQLINQWLEQFGPDKLVLALDCRLTEDKLARVCIHGWQVETPLNIYTVLERYPTVQYVLCTDVGRDGTLGGPNIELYKQILRAYPHLALIASGGVAVDEDIIELNQLGIYGVVVGKALYEGKINLAKNNHKLKFS